MVHLTPRAAKSAAMSTIGMRCPGARNGKKRMCSGCSSSALMAMAGCVPVPVPAPAKLRSCRVDQVGGRAVTRKGVARKRVKQEIWKLLAEDSFLKGCMFQMMIGQTYYICSFFIVYCTI